MTMVCLVQQGVCRLWSCQDFPLKGDGELEDEDGPVEMTVSKQLDAADFFRTVSGEKPDREALAPLVPIKAVFHPVRACIACAARS